MRRTRKGSIFGEPFLTEEEIKQIEEEENKKKIEKENKKLERQKQKEKLEQEKKQETISLITSDDNSDNDELYQTSKPDLKNIESNSSSDSSSTDNNSDRSEQEDFKDISINNLQSTQFFANILSSTQLSNTIVPEEIEEIVINMAEFPIVNFHKAIPEFSGTIAELNRFLACCDLFHGDLTTDPHRAAFLKVLVKKFTGRAFDFYAKQIWANWDELKNALKKYFSSSNSFEGYQIQLSKQRQGNLDVKQFSEKIQQILLDMNRVSNEVTVNNNQSGTQFFKAQNEKLAIKSLINGMNEPIRGYLKSQIFTNLQSAINTAIELESDENVHNKFNTIHNSNFKRNNDKQITCFRCKKNGHLANNCRVRLYNGNGNDSRNNNFNTNPQSNFNRNFKKNQITCFRCHKIGHTVPNCRVNLNKNGNFNSNSNPNSNSNSNFSNRNYNQNSNTNNSHVNQNSPRYNSRGSGNNNRNSNTFVPNRNQSNGNYNRNANIIEAKNEIEQTAEMDNACLDLIAM